MANSLIIKELAIFILKENLKIISISAEWLLRW